VSGGEDNRDTEMEEEGDTASIPEGATRQRLKVWGSYPQPPQDALNGGGKDTPAFSGRSSLTLRTPPRLNSNDDGSLGS